MSAAAGRTDVARVLTAARGARIWVVGDLMLDEYLEGRVERISPEAPVPVVRVERSFQRPGGAAHVAHAVAALGARAVLAGVVGDDAAGEALLRACRDGGVDVDLVSKIEGRPTVRKRRVLAHDQQLLRIDWESSEPIARCALESMVARLVAGPAPDAIVLSDYAKGVLAPDVVRALVDEGRRRGVPVLVDPKRSDFEAYRGATVITPNRRELEAALAPRAVGDEASEVASAARPLLDRADLGALVVTLGKRGLVVVPREGEAELVPAARREVYDVTGAGDNVVATLAVALAAGAPLALAARLANEAAGLAVERVGAAVVTPAELGVEIAGEPADKVLPRDALLARARAWRAERRRIVFTNGCFDLLHVGHLALLRAAAAMGDVLVVGVNDDASVARHKGPGRPLVAAADRAALLAAIQGVDAVTLFHEDTPLALVEALRPDVLVKGGDYRADEVVGRDIVEAGGGRVAIVPLVAGRSTSEVASRLRDRAEGPGAPRGER